MRPKTPALMALATSLLVAPPAFAPAHAKENTGMNASLGERTPPFHDAAIRPLADAIADGDVARIRALAPDADLSARGARDVTLLEWAIWNEQPEALAALLDAGADPAQSGMDGETVVHMAAMTEDPRYLQVLLAAHAPMDLTGDQAGRTPVFHAVQYRRGPQFDLLAKAGADLHRTDRMGNSLLHVAGQVNDAERALQLLELGVDARATNHAGKSFQDSLLAGSDARLNAAGLKSRQQVRDWLAAHGVDTAR